MTYLSFLIHFKSQHTLKASRVRWSITDCGGDAALSATVESSSSDTEASWLKYKPFTSIQTYIFML